MLFLEQELCRLRPGGLETNKAPVQGKAIKRARVHLCFVY